MGENKEISLKSELEQRESANSGTSKLLTDIHARSDDVSIAISDKLLYKQLSAITSNLLERSVKTSSTSESLQPSMSEFENPVTIGGLRSGQSLAIIKLLLKSDQSQPCSSRCVPTYDFDFERIKAMLLELSERVKRTKEASTDIVETSSTRESLQPSMSEFENPVTIGELRSARSRASTELLLESNESQPYSSLYVPTYILDLERVRAMLLELSERVKRTEEVSTDIVKTSSSSESLDPSISEFEKPVTIGGLRSVQSRASAELLLESNKSQPCSSRYVPTCTPDFERMKPMLLDLSERVKRMKEVSIDVEMVPTLFGKSKYSKVPTLFNNYNSSIVCTSFDDSNSSIVCTSSDDSNSSTVPPIFDNSNSGTLTILSAIEAFFKNNKTSLDELLVKLNTLKSKLDERNNQLASNTNPQENFPQCSECQRAWESIMDSWNSSYNVLPKSIYIMEIITKRCNEKIPTSKSEFEDFTLTLEFLLNTSVSEIQKFYYALRKFHPQCPTPNQSLLLTTIHNGNLEYMQVLAKFASEKKSFKSLVEELKD